MSEKIQICETTRDFTEFLYTNKNGKIQVKRGTWKNVENHRIYAKSLAKHYGYTTMEHWYQITKQQIIDFYGGGIIINYYNGSSMKFVVNMFPDYDWKGYKFSSAPNGYWDPISNRKNYAYDLGQHLGYTEIKDWYQITVQQIKDFYGRGSLPYYNNSPMKFVMEIFPEHNWKGYKFGMAPIGYWDPISNRKNYAYDLGEHLGYTEMKDWYQITVQQIKDFYGCGLLKNYYNDSPMKFVMVIFPEHNWKAYKFTNCPRDYWKEMQNRKTYVDDLGKHLGYITWEDWYQITQQQIIDFKGGGLVKYYNCSLVKFVMDMFPEHNWKGYKFTKCSNEYWKEMQNRKSYADDLGKHLGYITWEDWYQITQQQIIDFYGRGLSGGYYNGSPMQFVMDMYPEHNWDISKFSNHKTEKIVLKFLEERYPSVIFQFKQDWCKAKRYLPFDFCLPELKIIIELDGAQHFRQVSNWESPEFTQAKDEYKMKCANDNQYSVIRIVQEDVLYEVYDWKTKLIESIEEIKNADSISNIFLSMEDEY